MDTKELPKSETKIVEKLQIKPKLEVTKNLNEIPEKVLFNTVPISEQRAVQFEQEKLADTLISTQSKTVEIPLINAEYLVEQQIAELVVQPFIESLDAPELDETNTLKIELTEDQNFNLEISETVVNYEEPTLQTYENEGLEQKEQPSVDIDDEFARAAQLWSEQWVEPEDDLYIEANTPEIETKALIEFLPISTIDLEEKLETIPEGRLQETAAILEVVFKLVSNLENDEKIETLNLEIVTTKLEQMVERLFVCLEIEHEEEHIIAFVQAILSGEIKIDFEALLTLQDEGMHERKYTSAWILAVLNQKTTSNERGFAFVGTFVLALFLRSDTQHLGHKQLA